MPTSRRRIFFPTLFLWALLARAAEPVVDWDKAYAETLLHYQSIVRVNTSSPPGSETSVVNYLKEVLDRIRASVKGSHLPGICGSCRWLPLGYCRDGIDQLREGQVISVRTLRKDVKP